MADDKRGGGRVPVGLQVRLSYGNVDEFVEKFATNISRGGVFIWSRDPKPVGTVVELELRLAGGEKVVRGQGVVRWVSFGDEKAKPPKPAGMGIQFMALDDASRAIVERMASRREAGLAPQSGAGAVSAPALAEVPPPTRAPGPIASPGAPAEKADGPQLLQRDVQGPAVDIGLPANPEPPKKLSALVIGIDLGTTNSCAAVVKDGKPYVIPSREGHNVVPSMIALNARNKIVVGHVARSQLLTNPRNTVYGAKRLMGRPFHTRIVQEMKAKFPYEIVPGPQAECAVKLGPVTLSLEQVAALILKEVREVAERHLGEEVNRAVITVPAYYNERQRSAVRTAALYAGIHVERILNEPTAAAMAYAYGRDLRQRVLIYDLGGGTFDASVLELHDNVYEVLSTGGDTFLGGMDFDDRVARKLLESYEKRAGKAFDGDRIALSRVFDAAERAKCALSERTEIPVQIPFLGMVGDRPISLDLSLTRADLQALVNPLVERSLFVCEQVLADRKLESKDIDEVLLVGGQSRMPFVRERVKALFGKEPSKSVHPDEAVAIGAALLAHALQGQEGVVLIDVLPMSIGIGLPGGRVKTVIPRNTPLPARKQYGLSTTRDDQEDFELVILQGDTPDAVECEYLGTLRLTGLPKGPRGTVKIVVTFDLGAECLLSVTAREMVTGKEVRSTLSTLDTAPELKQKLRADATAIPMESGPQTAPLPPLLPRGLMSFFRRLFG